MEKAPIDAVVVVSPVYLHAEQTVLAAQAGKHVLCEKPMARTLSECDRMISGCRGGVDDKAYEAVQQEFPVR